LKRRELQEQKFFAALFFKKATASIAAIRSITFFCVAGL
jgi:hypothetical protein